MVAAKGVRKEGEREGVVLGGVGHTLQVITSLTEYSYIARHTEY